MLTDMILLGWGGGGGGGEGIYGCGNVGFVAV